ncbi:MAG: signal recognition particle-docking protein FtsY [Nanoarchaeota archaeon]|nr:signal recognition particle-docking protein FtsY [Nanoarchaeota archaeon]
MFKFLKEKIKQAVSSITKKVEDDPTIKEELQEPAPQPKIEKKKEEQTKKETPKPEKKKVIIKTGLELPAILQDDHKKQQEKEAIQEAEKETVVEPPKEEKKKGFFSRLFEKREEQPKEQLPAVETKEEQKKEALPETTKTPEKTIPEQEPQTAEQEAPEEPKEEKKGFFASIKEKIVTKKIDNEHFEELFFDLELALLENNVAYEVVNKIKEDLRQQLVNKPLPRGKIEEAIHAGLKKSIDELLTFEPFDLVQAIKNKKEKPYVIVFVGVNGAGKTTNLAKLAYHLKKQGISSVIAAGDTFRAASLEQLEEHGKKLGIRVIKHDYGSDAAAVAHDAISSAKANNTDVVLIDTAGRQHSNENLMREMEKIIRIAKPDLKLFIGESIVGNDAVVQSQEFNQAIGLDGIILTKADIDEKGGAMLSVSYVTKKPILYLGKGQTYEDLEPFDKKKIMENLGL